MFSSSCIFLFLVLIMAPSHPINSMSYNYCLKEKNIGEVKQTNKQWNFCLLDPVLKSGHKNRSWRIAEDLGYLSNSLSEESGEGKKTEDHAVSRKVREWGLEKQTWVILLTGGASAFKTCLVSTWTIIWCQQFLKVMRKPRNHPQTSICLFQGA